MKLLRVKKTDADAYKEIRRATTEIDAILNKVMQLTKSVSDVKERDGIDDDLEGLESKIARIRRALK